LVITAGKGGHGGSRVERQRREDVYGMTPLRQWPADVACGVDYSRIAQASRARKGLPAMGILQGIPDQDEPGAIIARLIDAVPPGSYLAISQIASDVAADEVAQGVQRYNEQAAVPVAARTHARRGLPVLRGPGVGQARRRPGAPVAARNREPGQRPQPGHLRRDRAETVTAGPSRSMRRAGQVECRNCAVG
jgi:hypothetical protein